MVPLRISIIHRSSQWSWNILFSHNHVRFPDTVHKLHDGVTLEALPNITVPDVVHDVRVLEEVAPILTEQLDEVFVCLDGPAVGRKEWYST